MTTTSASATETEAEASPNTKLPISALPEMARTLRRHIVTMIGAAGSGHPGGSLSAVEIVATLYFHTMRHDKANPHWPDRDRFIMSKGHGAPLLYATLAEAGYLSLSELSTLRRAGSRLQGHTDMTLTPGVEMSAGSLGQGLSFGLGVALAGRLDGRDYRVYVLTGDGECDEGQIWEAAMAAAHFKVDNLVAIVDHNELQIDGWVRNIMNLEPLADKWRAFGWYAMEVDGHDLGQIIAALERAKSVKGQPTAIIAHTIKGKGVSFMENNVEFHGRAPTQEEVARALAELG
ncbi:MAG: transketolase [Chloroflexi bacterium]|nr:transketolase [Chloroflexota bacterium]